MAQERNPLRDKAKEMYLSSKGKIKLTEIAQALDLPDGTIRGWKNKQRWDDELNRTLQNVLERNAEDGMERFYDWLSIEKEYITSIQGKPISLRKIADKYNIPHRTLISYSAKHNWSAKRKEYKAKTIQKVIDNGSTRDADRIVRLLNITDRAMDKIEKAVEELEQYTVSSKRKRTEKIKILDESTGREIGTTESSHEEVEYSTVDGIVDKEGIMYITNSLKNIKDLYSITKNIEEQDARIANLKSKTTDSDDGEETGVILLAPVLEEVEDEQ